MEGVKHVSREARVSHGFVRFGGRRRLVGRQPGACAGAGRGCGPAAAPAAVDTAPATATDEDGQPIVVTGSRIARAGFSAPTPTTVVGTDEIKQSGAVNLQQALNELPQLKNSVSATSRRPIPAPAPRRSSFAASAPRGPSPWSTAAALSATITSTSCRQISSSGSRSSLAAPPPPGARARSPASSTSSSTTLSRAPSRCAERHFDPRRRLPLHARRFLRHPLRRRPGSFHGRRRICRRQGHRHFRQASIVPGSAPASSAPATASFELQPDVNDFVAAGQPLTYGGAIITGVLAGNAFGPDGLLHQVTSADFMGLYGDNLIVGSPVKRLGSLCAGQLRPRQRQDLGGPGLRPHATSTISSSFPIPPTACSSSASPRTTPSSARRSSSSSLPRADVVPDDPLLARRLFPHLRRQAPDLAGVARHRRQPGRQLEIFGLLQPWRARPPTRRCSTARSRAISPRRSTPSPRTARLSARSMPMRVTTNDDPACVPFNPFGDGAPSAAARAYVTGTQT